MIIIVHVQTPTNAWEEVEKCEKFRKCGGGCSAGKRFPNMWSGILDKIHNSYQTPNEGKSYLMVTASIAMECNDL